MIHVTDHGLIRWMERVRRVDVDAVRTEIEARLARAAAAAAEIGEPSYRIWLPEATCLIIDGRLVTVLAPAPAPARQWITAERGRS